MEDCEEFNKVRLRELGMGDGTQLLDSTGSYSGFVNFRANTPSAD